MDDEIENEEIELLPVCAERKDVRSESTDIDINFKKWFILDHVSSP